MTKQEFIDEVKNGLTGLAETDIQKAMEFYTEAIDDRIDDGLSEEQAVAEIGTPAEITEKILMDTPLPKLVKAQTATKPAKTWRVWEIILIVLGSPVWLPVGIALFAVVLALCIALLAVVFSLIIAVFASGVGGVVSIFASLTGIAMGKGMPFVVQLAGSLVITGIAFLLFIPIKAGFLWLIDYISVSVRKIKQRFIDKRNKANTLQNGQPDIQ